jgi:DUF1365 family protein
VRSALYEGWVRHVRCAPRQHAFRVPLWLLYLDLEELNRVFHGRRLWSLERPNWISLRRRDYLGDPRLPLERCVRDLVEGRLGRRPDGSIQLLTLPRSLGISFNPVSFFYCRDAEGGLDSLVAEVTNIPWLERHCYVLDLRAARRPGRWLRCETGKRLHVSPFMDMQSLYQFRLCEPGERLAIGIACRRGGRTFFDACFEAERREICGRTLARALLRQPCPAGRVVAHIYWQALRLAHKRTPLHSHPVRCGPRIEVLP